MGYSPGPSDGAKLQLSWLAKPALYPPFIASQALAIQGLFQNVPSLSFFLLSDVKPGTTKKEGGKNYLSYARNLFLQLPHARRYVNAPSGPPQPPPRPGARGLAQFGAGTCRRGHVEAESSAPAKPGKESNCKAIAQHKMRQQSKGQTLKNRLTRKERPSPGPALR